MRQIEIAPGLPTASILGLGCSRLGSMTSEHSPAEARKLVTAALSLGVTLFDTSNIYAQGRSEQILGQALQGRRDVSIVTKAGQVFPLKHRLLSPLKGPVSALLKHSRSAQAGVRAARSQGLPRNYSPEHLKTALEASLRRLRRTEVEAFLLHSPRIEHISDGVALDALTGLKQSGKARTVGVSVDDESVLERVADDPRVDVIQAPFGIARRAFESSLARASARGALIIAREVLSADAGVTRPSPADAVRFSTGHPHVMFTLVGTGNIDHLRQAVEAARH
ncbi:aldo/keto reductase [Phenylobacterium sp.]|uniref:aldo/keto reductase n=1 Tax=Phenylobacterium sp. TaxID=1871053 RepID=UPI00301CBFFB